MEQVEEHLVQELWGAISTEFQSRMMADRRLARLSNKVSKGIASYKDVGAIAQRVGNHSAKALKKVLTADAVPGGIMTWGMAEKTVGRQARLQYDLISETALTVQKSLNQKAGLGLRAVVGDFDEDNIREILGRLSSGESLKDLTWLLDDPIVRNALSVADSAIRANADLDRKAGMKPTVTRIAEFNACAWCEDLAGTYDYADVRDKGNDVWRRHNNCRCEILYDPGDSRYGR